MIVLQDWLFVQSVVNGLCMFQRRLRAKSIRIVKFAERMFRLIYAAGLGDTDSGRSVFHFDSLFSTDGAQAPYAD